MRSSERCIKLLDNVLLIGGTFDYDAAMRRLLEMRTSGNINV